MGASYHSRVKFYGGRHSLGLATALAVTAGLLVVVGTSPPATAATVVPCTQTFAGPAKDIAPETTPTTAPAYTWTTSSIAVPASSNVEDIDVTYDLTHPHASNLQTRLTRMVGTTVTKSISVQPRLTADTSAQVRPLTFDDEASSAYTATSPSGRYGPAAPLSDFDGSAAGATWRLDVANYENITTARLNSWSVTITYSACDADGDGAEDHTDNCVGLANPGQLDLDGDGSGNECDGDLDGDGAVDDADNCLTLVNPDQADADGDGSGDVCDGDRDGDGAGGADNCVTVANPDQADADADGAGNACDLDDDADGVDDTTDRCPHVGGAAATGCPPVDRTIKLRHKAAKRLLAGRLTADVAVCQAGQSVTVWQARRGKDRRIDRARSSAAGRFKTKLRRRTGTFYARVSGGVVGGVADCSATRSRKVMVRR